LYDGTISRNRCRSDSFSTLIGYLKINVAHFGVSTTKAFMECFEQLDIV